MPRKLRPSKRIRPGRPKKDRELLIDAKGKQVAHFTGMDAHAIRAFACYVAYCIGVSPKGGAIHRKLRDMRDALIEKGSEDELFLESMEGDHDGSSKWNHFIRAEREPHDDTLEFIALVVSEQAADSFGACDFSNCERDNYFRFQFMLPALLLPAKQLPSECGIVSYHTYFPEDHPTRPPPILLEVARRFDTTGTLEFFKLLFGTAHEQGWPDLYEKSFEGIVDIACRLASVPPFVTFGKQFLQDLISSIVSERPVVNIDWKPIIKQRFNHYQQLLELAYDEKVQLLSKTPDRPMGDRWKELGFLRFSDGCDFASLYAALHSRQHTGKVPDLYARAKTYIAAYKPPPEDMRQL